MLLFVLGIFELLFSDTKLPENLPQYLVGSDFADDGADEVEGFAEVLGEEVGWKGRGWDAWDSGLDIAGNGIAGDGGFGWGVTGRVA